MSPRSSRFALIALLIAGAAPAQEPPASKPKWSFGAVGAWNFLPDQADFLQPTFRADRGWLHLESRYNYEDRDSLSFFVGANFEGGDKVKLSFTPMLGGLVGETEGVIPALEADLTVWRLEVYGEAEYVFNLDDSSDQFFYMWSEISVWPTEWLRAGMVAQRTRVYRTERDIQRGLLVGVALSKVEAAVYLFNTGADDQLVVASLGISF